MDAAQLETIPLFGGLTAGQRSAAARACTELFVEAGAMLVREGDFGHAVFAIRSGTADVVHDGAVVNRSGRATTSARSQSCPEVAARRRS